jgi:hypothetical protein
MTPQRTVESVYIQLSASEGDDEVTQRDVLDFYTWLRRTENVAEHADISLRPAQQDDADADAETDADTMGAVEIIDMALGHGFEALNLALAYATWRLARPSGPAVTLTTRRGSVTVRGGSEEEIRRIVTALDGVEERSSNRNEDRSRSSDSDQESPGA